MKVFSLFLINSLFFFVFSFLNCKGKKDYSAIFHSLREDIDIYIIPEKFNILEGEWVEYKSTSNFAKSDLIRHLKSYGRTISDLEKNSELNYVENDGIVTMDVKKTFHSTYYNYDKKIPVIFYGPNWFKKGEYSDIIHQQHIVPTLTKILDIRNPNGVETHPILKILKDQNNLEKPEIIVTIVVDQGGQQLYNSHPDVPVNISGIRKESAYFPNAEVGHLDAHTAVGHAAIGTGAYPTKNLVVGNNYFQYENGKITVSEIYSDSDPSESKVNPGELATESLADVLDNENGDKSEVISQCYAPRASIGMAGHGSYKLKNVGYTGDRDFVYWIDKKTKIWTTDERYYSLPSFISEYNPIDNYLKEYPHGWKNHHANTKEEASQNWSIVLASPAEVKLESEVFRRTLEEQIINKNKHKDGYTDLAYITFKATDAAGHQFGWESLESKEAFSETDKQIGLIFEMLKKHYGNKFILIITADHGCAPLPEISGGKRLTFNKMFDEVQKLVPPDEKTSPIKFSLIGQISLNKEILKKHNITEEQVKQKLLGIKVEGKPFFKKVILKSELLKDKE